MKKVEQHYRVLKLKIGVFLKKVNQAYRNLTSILHPERFMKPHKQLVAKIAVKLQKLIIPTNSLNLLNLINFLLNRLVPALKYKKNLIPPYNHYISSQLSQRLYYYDLTGADLQGAGLREKDLSGCELLHAGLLYADLSDIKVGIENNIIVKLTKVILHGAILPDRTVHRHSF